MDVHVREMSNVFLLKHLNSERPKNISGKFIIKKDYRCYKILFEIFNGIFLRSNQWESSSQPSNIALHSYRLSFFTIFYALWLISLIPTNLFLPSQISSSPFSVLKIYPGQLSQPLSQISLSTYTAEAICEHIAYIVFQ